jgi:putative addiction module component (TIGR02574 family)
MTTKTLELIELAEALPLDERAAIVDRLLESMYPHQQEIDEAWRIEAERRVEDFRSSQVKTISGEKAFKEIHSQVRTGSGCDWVLR